MSSTSRYRRVGALGCLAIAGCLPLVAAASTQECDAPLNQEQLQQLVNEAILGRKIDDVPRATASTKKLNAASDTGDSNSLVDQPSLTELVGIAIDRGLVGKEGSAYTTSLNAFSVLSFVKPAALDYQSEYGRYTFLRRWGGSASFGGKGEAFDQDGDGTIDEALEADNFDDIFNWEVQYRFVGTRDRRDHKNYQKFFDATRDSFGDWAKAFTAFLGNHTDDIVFDQAGNACKDSVQRLLNRDDVRKELEAIARAQKSLDDEIETVADEIDNSMLWTVVFGGTQREDKFGPDKRMAAIRGSFRKFTFNAAWEETDSPAGGEKPQTVKAGVEYSWLWLKNSALSKNGIEFRLAGKYELFDNVPNAAVSNNAKLNVKLDFPVIKGLKIPISLTWANHTGLLNEEDQIVGRIGFTVDTSEFSKIFQPDK